MSLSVMSPVVFNISVASAVLRILRPSLSFFFLAPLTFENVMGRFGGNCSAGRCQARASDFVRRVLYCAPRTNAIG